MPAPMTAALGPALECTIVRCSVARGIEPPIAITDGLMRLTYGLDRLNIAALDELDDLLARLDVDAGLTQRLGDGQARSERFQATTVAAVAGDPGTARDLH